MKIKFEPTGNTVPLTAGDTVLQAARKAGVRIRSECGGKGVCGKCRIINVGAKGLGKVKDAERRHLSKHELQKGFRLACCSVVEQDVVVMIPQESRMNEMRILAEGLEGHIPLNPAVIKVHTYLSKPTMTDIQSDTKRLLATLTETSERLKIQPSLSYETLTSLPDVLRTADWDVTLTIWNGRELIDVEAGNTTASLYGVAVDIGTSSIVLTLVDLTTGKVVSIKSVENPQIVFGDDIVSRILYASQGKRNLREIQHLVIRFINLLLNEAAKEAHIQPRNIYTMTVVGNTAMHHLFLRIQPKYLSLAPYIPALTRSLDIQAKEIKVKINPEGYVHVLPVVAGYVGADAVADVLASGIHETDKMSLLVDIGTNGEIFVGNKDGIVACSCAAGPAFEGAHIKHGMRAYVGAIERVQIVPKTYHVEYTTIGRVKPVGLCGSGIVDAVAELFKCGIINNRGRFTRTASRRLQEQNGEKEFVLVDKDETENNRAITVTQSDVDEIQLAKAALHTGCAILMKRKGVSSVDIEQLLIAGAFGSYINPESIRFIGLIPDVPVGKMKFLGNTALSGAKMTLLSQEARDAASNLSSWIDYVELAADPDFKREYLYSMYLPHRKKTFYPSVLAHFEK